MSDAAITIDTALKLIEIASLIGGGAIVVYRMGRMTTRFEMIGERQAAEISELKKGVEKIGAVVTDLAIQKTRLDQQGEQIALLDRRYEELRHGEGFVFPLDTHMPSPRRP